MAERVFLWTGSHSSLAAARLAREPEKKLHPFLRPLSPPLTCCSPRRARAERTRAHSHPRAGQTGFAEENLLVRSATSTTFKSAHNRGSGSGQLAWAAAEEPFFVLARAGHNNSASLSRSQREY